MSSIWELLAANKVAISVLAETAGALLSNASEYRSLVLAMWKQS